jgi:hypothetical protein
MILSMLFLFSFFRGPDQWTLVPLAIGQDIHTGPPSTSLAASVVGDPFTREHVLGARLCSHRELTTIPLHSAMPFASLAHPYHYMSPTSQN